MGIAETKEILLVGRFIVGAGIGLASMSVPMYISEASPPHFRGLLVTCYNLIITFGQFVASCICGAFSNYGNDGWKWMLGLAAVPATIQFFGFIFMPESPRWLVSKGKIE
jgi:SP family myo-inositol transporter-like MFS transporter 13